MAGHLGLNGQLPGGLGLVSQRADAGVSRETSAAAPVVGVERTQIGSPADLAQRPAPAPAPAAKPASGVPQFEDNPLGAIGIILQEVAAGIRGDEGPVAKANKLALQREGLRLRTAAATFEAVKQGVALTKDMTPEQAEGALVTLEKTISLPGVGDMVRAMNEAGNARSKAALDFVEEHKESLPLVSALMERGIITPSQAPGFLAEMAALTTSSRITESTKAEFREGSDKFSAPFENDRGQLVQENLVTNELKVLDQEQDEFSDPFRNDDGDLVQLNLRTKQQKVLSKTGKTPEDIKARKGAENAADAVAGLQKGATGIANIVITLEELEKAGGSAGGLKGLAIEKIGGFLGQFNEAAEEGFAKMLGDATPEEVQAIRTRSTVIVAQMLEEITAEETGRFTDTERTITQEALKTLDPNASTPQIRAALVVALELRLISRDRRLTIAGVAAKSDLDTDEGLDSKGKELEKFGLKPSEIVPILKRLRLQRQLMKGLQ